MIASKTLKKNCRLIQNVSSHTLKPKEHQIHCLKLYITKLLPLPIDNLLADYFASVYQRQDHEVINKNQLTSDFIMSPILIDEVKSILVKLDHYKASSPDNKPAIFYKNLSGSIILPLSILYNKSLSEYPTLWKTSYVTPTFKTGNRSTVENYRPISILCTISKVFERLIFNRLYAHVREHIRPSQHGFVSGKSVQSNLLEYMNFIVKSISNGGHVDTIFTDLFNLEPSIC